MSVFKPCLLFGRFLRPSLLPFAALILTQGAVAAESPAHPQLQAEAVERAGATANSTGGTTAGAAGPSSDERGLQQQSGFVRAMPPGHPVNGGFFSLKNTSGSDISIVGACSESAKRVEIHEHQMRDGLMRMREVEAIAVAAGDTVEFVSGGYHLMIFGLSSSLALGDNVTVNLKLADGSLVELQLPLQLGAGKAKPHKH